MRDGIGAYRFIRALGHGATASVFLAERPGSETKYAIKVFHPSLWNQPEFRKRAESELRFVQELDGPGILKVHEALFEADVTALVFDYVEGGDLERFQSRLPYVLPELSVIICCEILKALEYAHQKGIVHRDIKPSNVLVDLQKSQILIADFGLAKMKDAVSTTLTGAVMGSPDYMSPEQVRGETATVRSDLYSVGALLYFLVTGTRPFARSSALAVLDAVNRGVYEKPEKRNPKVSDSLSQLISRSLSLRAEDRFQTALEMRETFEAYLIALGLTPKNFNLSEWLKNPSDFVFSAMEQSASSLLESAKHFLAKREKSEALVALRHLSLIAPSASEFPSLMQLALQKPKSRKLWYASAALGLAFMLGAFALLRNEPHEIIEPTSSPAAQIVQTEPITTNSPSQMTQLSSNSAVKKKQLPQPTATASLARRPNGTVRFEVPSNVKVYWDGKLIPQQNRFMKVKVGTYSLKLLKNGSQPIESKIKVNEHEPVVIRAR
jgi:serine/threonine protein kinase